MTQINEIRPYASQILYEEYVQSERNLTFTDFVKNKIENDRGFYNWLFPDVETIKPFGIGMQWFNKEEFQVFMEDVNSLSD